MQLLGAVLTSLYYIVCFLLVLYGLYRVWLLRGYLRADRHPRSPAPPAVWPHVTVQLPLYNERWVARRLLQAVARLDYPRDRLQIQVLDDSTDRTRVLTRRLCRLLGRRGFDVQHLSRARRTGYKAGALDAGLRVARGELLAIFDADFVPPADFLRRMVPWVLQSPRVGVAQARWGHGNRDASWFTRLQAILLDGHFVIEQTARSAGGYFLSFNGTCGIWRKHVIEAAGGWQSDTVTEDLDLSFRAQLAGYRVVYVGDVVVPGELPVEPNSFRSQQRRWTKGGVQVARKLLPQLLRQPLPGRVKLEACLHLTCYAAYPLLLLLALLRTPARLVATESRALGFLPGEVELLLLGTIPLVVFYTVALRGAGCSVHRFDWLRRSLPAMALGAGLAVSNTRAVLDGLFSRDLTFERTPKQGTRTRRQAGYRLPASLLAGLELALVVYLVAWKIWGTGMRVWADLPFVVFFGFGLLAMALPSLSFQRRTQLAP